MSMVEQSENDICVYADMVGLPHPVSATRQHMTRRDRAAQFSPFAALNGYGAAIDETARRTNRRDELAEDEKAALDVRLRFLRTHAAERPHAMITYFKPDERKAGGAYITADGFVKSVDETAGVIVFTDGTRIGIDDIYAVESELLPSMESYFPAENDR